MAIVASFDERIVIAAAPEAGPDQAPALVDAGPAVGVMGAKPMEAKPMGAVPVGAVPVGAVPVGAVPVGGSGDA
jgi:hypothetical protein